MNVLIVKYGEVAMRGNNRGMFLKKIISSIRKNIDPIGSFYVVMEQGRLIVESRGGEMDFDAVIPRVITVFGITAVCPGVKTDDQSIENLKKISLSHMKEFFEGKELTFKVDTKRANKNYPLISREISAEIGEYILENMPKLSVDVHKPQIKLYVELRNDAYITSKVIKGYGGLPMGSSGIGVSLLSGGIDSPVASWLMAKRGVEVEGVYFHSPPYTSERAKQKVIDLAQRIATFTGEFKLYVIPFTELQLYLLENVPHDKLTIFLKRAMMRVAEIIAQKDGALGLITGESVGQVASQTMHGINAIDAVCTYPVLRPLAGLDKQEIIDIAKKIGTFDISIRPYEDCCTIFVAKHPQIKPKTSVINKMETKLERLEELINKSVEGAEIINI